MKRVMVVLLLFHSWCILAHETPEPPLKINEIFQNQSLKEVLSLLKRKYDLKLAYSDKLVRDISIDMTIADATIPEAFSQLFSACNLSFEYIPPGSVIVKKGSPSNDTFNLNGEIVDVESGERLAFVYLFIEPDNKSISSNEDGLFSINNITTNTTIRLSCLGYRDTIVALSAESKNRRLLIPLKRQENNLNEIVILGDDNKDFKQVATTNAIDMSANFAAQIPQSTEKDVFRTMQLLPGVTATNELSSGLYINGGTANQNLVLFDGIPIYHVDHFFGYFSAINPNAIQSMRLFKGGFDAKYGGRASSMVEFIGKDGNRDKVSGSISFNLLSANTSLEVPVNETTTIFLSARRSYTDVLRTGLFDDIFSIYENTNFEVASPEIVIQDFDVEPEFYYTDLNFKISTMLGLKNRVSLSYYDSQDILNYEESLLGNLSGDTIITQRNVGNINWGNVGSSLKFSRLWNTSHFSNLVMSYSYYESDFKENNMTTVSQARENYMSMSSAAIDQRNYIKDLSIKIDHEWMLGLNKIEFGASFSRYNTQIKSEQNDSIITFKDQPESIIFTQYIQDKYDLSPNTQLSVGLRGNYLSNLKQYNFEPRIGVNHRFNKAWTGSFATGTYRQFVNQVNTTNSLQGSRDLWLLSDFEIPSQRSIHYMAGITRAVAHSTITVSGFYKTFDGLLDYAFRQGDLVTEYTNYEELFFEGQGVAKGLELMIKQSIGNFSGWLSYTMSKTEYKFEQLNAGRFYPADHDQTHELNVFGSYKIGAFTLFSTWYYGSGRPYSALNPPADNQRKREANKRVIRLNRDEKNNFRLPAYHRLDIGANYDLDFGSNKLRISGKIFNVYNRTNVYERRIDLLDVASNTPGQPRLMPQPTVVDINLMGITPSISLDFIF